MVQAETPAVSLNDPDRLPKPKPKRSLSGQSISGSGSNSKISRIAGVSHDSPTPISHRPLSSPSSSSAPTPSALLPSKKPAVDETELSKSFSELECRAEQQRPRWEIALDCARQAAALSNDDMLAEGRREAAQRYAPGEVDHFFPEPPSVARLTRLADRSGEEEAIAMALDAFAASSSTCRTALMDELKQAKAAGDRELTRRFGRRANALYTLTARARALDAPVRTRLTISIRRIAAFRAACAIRPISPSSAVSSRQLTNVPPTRSGYDRVLDFYRFSDAARHSFGRAYSGPQFFTDIKRNVAVLHATRGEADSKCVYNDYAVSGENAPGLNLDGREGPFEAIACEDGLGEHYLRDHDAEYKLVTEFCARHLDMRRRGAVCTEYRGRITLWSKKPLCASCSDVFYQQLGRVLPRATLEVRVDDSSPGHTPLR